jgi:hypothetical protein
MEPIYSRRWYLTFLIKDIGSSLSTEDVEYLSNIEENEEDHLLNIGEANQESFPMAHRGCEKPQDEKERYYVFIRRWPPHSCFHTW